MKKLLLLLSIAATISSTQTLQAQTAPAKQWDRCFGGSSHDDLRSLKVTIDGGYILAGYSTSGLTGDKSQASHGSYDWWIVKVDASGYKIWDKSFGSTGQDMLYSIQQTTDGGYILGGLSLSGIGGDKTQPNLGSSDYWIIRLDSLGNKIWDKTIGGLSDDQLTSIQQTSDGGFIAGGYSNSNIGGDKTESAKGFYDYWIVKLDDLGVIQWDKTYGGSQFDIIKTVQQTTDGGYIVGGSSSSGINGDKSQASQGLGDYWIIKLDAAGNKVWDKTLGGNAGDGLSSLQQTSDGGYILGGISESGISGDKSQSSFGMHDYWVVKIDGAGNKTWDKTFGGNDDDDLEIIKQTNNGYIIGGSSKSGATGNKSQNTQGDWDYWIVKIDNNGNKVWDRDLGGYYGDRFYSLEQTSDGGYILGGYAYSGVTGDKSQASKGLSDYWIVKLGPEVVGLSETLTPNLTLYPNPTTGIIYLELKDQQPTQISVYNSLVQTILTKTEVQLNSDGNLQLDLSNHAKGIYTVQVISGNRSIVKKVVLQ